MMETTAKELQTRHKKQEARTEWGKMLFKSQCKVQQLSKAQEIQNMRHVTKDAILRSGLETTSPRMTNSFIFSFILSVIG